MDNVITLFTQYSAAEVVVLLVLMVAAFKFIGEGLDYIVSKVKAYFKKEQADETQQAQLIAKLDLIDTKIDSLGTQVNNLESRVAQTEVSIALLKDKVHDLGDSIFRLDEQGKKTEGALDLIQKKLQNQARDQLIAWHHKYVYEYKMIDDIGLEAMERTYLYYKAAGGNTFIDTLMDEVRELPRPALEDREILEAIQ